MGLGIDVGTDTELAADQIEVDGVADQWRQGITEVYNAIVSDSATCVTAGTADAFKASPTKCRRVDVQAFRGNTGRVAIGGAAVDATAATQKGIALDPDDTYTFYVQDLTDLFIDSEVSGDGVAYNYFT